MTDSFTAETGSVQSLHKPTPHNKPDSTPQFFPGGILGSQSSNTQNRREPWECRWSFCPFLGVWHPSSGGRNGMLLTQPGLASHLEVQVRTQLCVISP